MVNPDQIPGFSRRLRITPAPGHVLSEVEDDYHHMSVSIHHDNEIANIVEAVLVRAPWTTCPGAVDKCEQTFTGVALRAFVAASEGNFPNVFYFGGGDDFRASQFREFAGDRVFYANAEYRFPLLSSFGLFGALPLEGVRGRIFLDVAGAWFDYAGQDFDIWNSDESRLEDALAAYGWGLSLRFSGLDLHWDFSRRWNGDETLDDGYRTNFWIGTRF